MKYIAHYRDLFDPGRYLDEFRSFISTVEYSDRSPLNTEMFYMWCMIRALQPRLFIESGTFRGYSASIICEALARNDTAATFLTIGFNLEDCIPFAKQRLAPFSFARVIEGDSRQVLKRFDGATDKAAFFIDGPKGENMYPLLKLVLKKFPDFLFVAVHDCNKESGSGNRYCINNFFGTEFPILYSDTPFQQEYAELDSSIVGRSKLVSWSPFHLDGQPIDSYGTETGFVLGRSLAESSTHTLVHALSRYWRINIRSRLGSVIRRVKAFVRRRKPDTGTAG